MGAFIPIKVDEFVQEPDYSAEFEGNPLLQLPQFCSSRKISYTGFKNYLVANNISLKNLRTRTVHKGLVVSEQPLCVDFGANYRSISDAWVRQKHAL